MKIYEVEQSLKGRRIKTVVKAENLIEAKEKALRKNRANVIKTKQLNSLPVSAQIEEMIDGLQKGIFRPKVKIPNLVAVVRQLYVMTDAGISIHDSVKEVVNATEDKRLKEIFKFVYDDLNAGKSLTEALEPFRDELGAVFLAMIRLGEESGQIAEALKKLADIMQNVWDNQTKFKKAIRYPIIVVVAIIAAFTLLMILVVPEFRKIFEELNAQLPVPTIILLKIEYAMTNYGHFILLGLIALIFFIRFLYRSNKDFQFAFDKYVLKVYLIGNIIFFSTMNRFNIVFAELVRSGIPIVDALDTSIITVQNLYMKEKFSTVKVSIQRGNSLSDSVRETELYEGMLLQMMSAGEKSGSLDAMLDKITDYYKERFNNIVDNISAYVEPILLVAIAGMVLLMALGIFMPMWDLGQAVKV